jgi:hypothetical protein
MAAAVDTIHASWSHIRRSSYLLPAIRAAAGASPPNPSQLGILLPNPPPVTSRRRVREEQEAKESVRGRASSFAEPEPSGEEEPDRVVAALHLPLFPLHHAVVFFHAGKLTPCRFTNACTSARGHQGEPKIFPFYVDAPAFEPRGKSAAVRHRAAAHAAGDAGHRARLGKIFAGAAAVIAARAAPLIFPPLFLFAL